MLWHAIDMSNSTTRLHIDLPGLQEDAKVLLSLWESDGATEMDWVVCSGHCCMFERVDFSPCLFRDFTVALEVGGRGRVGRLRLLLHRYRNRVASFIFCCVETDHALFLLWPLRLYFARLCQIFCFLLLPFEPINLLQVCISMVVVLWPG